MFQEKLFIKNMVCSRCIMAVEQVLKDNEILFEQVTFGEVTLTSALTQDKQERLHKALQKLGFELIDDQGMALVEKIKSIVIKKARNEIEPKYEKWKLSALLVEELKQEYTYLSSFFSSLEGRTIENYFIEQRIEKAKELLVYGQLTLSEIAHQLNYSSVAHLSAQFKKVTGLTPSFFKQMGNQKRKALDKI